MNDIMFGLFVLGFEFISFIMLLAIRRLANKYKELVKDVGDMFTEDEVKITAHEMLLTEYIAKTKELEKRISDLENKAPEIDAKLYEVDISLLKHQLSFVEIKLEEVSNLVDFVFEHNTLNSSVGIDLRGVNNGVSGGNIAIDNKILEDCCRVLAYGNEILAEDWDNIPDDWDKRPVILNRESRSNNV